MYDYKQKGVPKMKGVVAAMLVAGVVLAGACATPTPGETLITFFYVVNQTGQDIKVRVLADDEELFIVEIGSEVELPDEGRISPPRGEYPARELKIPMREDTKVIKAQELISGMKKEWEMTMLTSKIDGGFTITIKEKDILLEKGYVPIR